MKPKIWEIKPAAFELDIAAMAKRLTHRQHYAAKTFGIYGIPSGGYHVAAALAHAMGVRMIWERQNGCLVVDDLVDSGTTWQNFQRETQHRAELFAVLYCKPDAITTDLPGLDLSSTQQAPQDAWLVFPWEAGRGEREPTDAVVRLLTYIGEDPNRDGLRDTPKRVVKALAEMCSGLREDPCAPLKTQFDLEPGQADNMVTLTGIPFTSLCEHHLLPFTGTATIGYIPSQDKVVGLSKLARCMDILARRPQVQERLTSQVAFALDLTLQPRGVGVVIEAAHACMSCRGIRKAGSRMVTSHLMGLIKTDSAARSEFMSLAGF